MAQRRLSRSGGCGKGIQRRGTVLGRNAAVSAVTRPLHLRPVPYRTIGSDFRKGTQKHARKQKTCSEPIKWTHTDEIFIYWIPDEYSIPVRGEITEVILKTSMNETSLWRAQTGFLPQSEQYGVYVKLERNDVYSLSMSCENFGGGMHNADFTAIESGEYIFLDNDIQKCDGFGNHPFFHVFGIFHHSLIGNGDIKGSRRQPEERLQRRYHRP